jgi:dTDP-4-dehydrorhamnose reductase
MIWLIGNKGMLGTEVETLLAASKFEFLTSDREVDITSYNDIESFSNGQNINWIINCAAYTAVDKSEDEEDIAYSINATGPENLAKLAKKLNAKLIHISTDYVFPGDEPTPRKEDDITGPTGAYGRTKLAGEQKIQEIFDEYFIIRTAWLYGPAGNNFVYTMLKLMKERDRITVVNDQTGSPTSAVDLAKLIFHIIDHNSSKYGIYHFSNEGKITWYDFAVEIKKLGIEYGKIDDTCMVEPCASDQFPTKAVRPAYSLMSKEKVKTELGFSVPVWENSLNEFFKGLS